MSPFDEIILILEKTKSRIVDGSHMDWTRYDTPAELRNEIDSWIERLKIEDKNVLSDVGIAFWPTGTFQETALGNGWHDEYMELAGRFDVLEKTIQEPSRKSKIPLAAGIVVLLVGIVFLSVVLLRRS